MLHILQQGGVAMYFLLACSVAMVAVIIERTIRLREASTDTIIFLAKLGRLVQEGRIGDAHTMCANVSPNSWSPGVATILLALSSPRDSTPAATAARPKAAAVNGQMVRRNSVAGGLPSTRAASVNAVGTSRTAGQTSATAHGKKRMTSAQTTGAGDGPL